MMTRITFIAGIVFLFAFAITNGQYVFKDDVRIPCTKVKNQQLTGTCWSFGTTSFLESEILRIKKVTVDLSEMYNVRMAYRSKALNYVLRQGKANFGEGGLPHDVLNVTSFYGIVPEEAYSGKTGGDTIYNHKELQASLNAYLDAVIKAERPSVHWMDAVNGILDAYLGPLPGQITFQGKSYDPAALRDALGIVPQDYVSFSSFTHHPLYRNFIMEIPDNWANGSFFNVKLDELMSIIDYALDHGYSLAWDADVSEKGFSAKNGIALLPANVNQEGLFEKPVNEMQVNELNRQENFMNYRTTDDHIMHIVGRAHDQNGNKFYIVKNSWGTNRSNQGYDYFSEAYMRMKTLSVTLHKDAVPKEILSRMK